ncbi:MAG: hypothetical protein WCF65_04035 [Parachlamydiaceae bacterium]
MILLLRLFLCIFLIKTTPAFADCVDTTQAFCAPNFLSIGPEIYRICRAKHGGTKQQGNAVGVRITFDHIKRYKIYYGVQAFYGSGILKGHSGGGDKIRSRLTDAQLEASLGYTFQTKCFPYVALTPYVGGGYFREINNFTTSSIPVKFTTQFPFAAFGFLSNISITPCLTVGVNARIRFPWEAHCKVTDDPEFDDVTQQIGNELQYRIEAPLTYVGDMLWNCFEVALIPFFERRLYGSRENYPFDFFETQFNIYGLNARLIFRF